MTVSAEDLRNGCQWLARELTRLEQLNRPLSFKDFYKWSEDGVFIKTIFKEYGQFMKGIQILDPDYEHHNKKLLVFMEDALGRHTNVITSGTYGVVDNAYLLAINVIFAISREADDF
ncbi:hypothetical protein ACUZX0_01095 [Serratia marcescens]|uniref:hypothetical protein n=1 Tax=Serratia marcescens TaxID=615 RepID=UPI004059AAD2